MDQMRHLDDLKARADLKARPDLQPHAAPGGYSVEPYLAGAAQPGHAAASHGLYLIDDRLAWEPPAAQALPLSPHELRRFSARLMAVQETERKRIAADLHDGIGQSLSLIKLSMESAVQLMMAGQNQQAIESMQRMVNRVKDAMAELRRATTDLHPPMLDDLGIIPTMTWFLREFEAACPEKKIEHEIGLDESDVPAPLKATIFRILQEATNNIVKHANADCIRVFLHKPGPDIQFAIEDNGQGFDPCRLADRRRAGTGFGLLTMKERAISSHGVFEIQSGPGQGTRILVTWRSRESRAATRPARGRQRGGK